MASHCASKLGSAGFLAIEANHWTANRLVNRALPPPGVKFKQSAMPFIQMENISHFLRACQSPPLNLQDHDVFLTVDLFEQKDPAQVLQCLNAFSRAASRVNPSAFPVAIGINSGRGGGVMSPQSTGPATPTGPTRNDMRGRGVSNASNTSSLYGRGTPNLAPSKTGDSGSGRWSPTKSPTNNGATSPVSVSSWSRRKDEGVTSPAWNIAQYGYMGGASQGNLGVAFGGRRQITSAGPYVPNMAEKERKRKEAAAEAERQRQQMEEEERRRKAEMEAEEERARLAEERRWEEETRRAREEERKKVEEEKRKWEEEERQWKLEEERRRKEEEEAEKRLQQERQRSRGNSDARLRGQFLSQYQAEQGLSPNPSQGSAHSGSEYGNRIKELEKELELARQRESEYQREREGRSRLKPDSPGDDKKSRARSRSRPASRPPSRQDSWKPKDDRPFLGQPMSPRPQRDWDDGTESAAPPPPPRSPRPLPDPTMASAPAPAKVKTHRTGEEAPSLPLRKQRTGEQGPPVPVRKHHTGSRPLPDPAAYAASASATATPTPGPSAVITPRTAASGRDYFGSNAALPPAASAAKSPPANTSRTPGYPFPKQAPPPSYSRDAEDRQPQRMAAAPPPKPAAKPTKPMSLLEREMELERQRQREWEEAQKETASRPRGEVDGVGGRWDVSQWSGYTGGDGQNRGAQGIGAGRRQIVGPRPLPGAPGR
jgi:hypothetical protein